MRRQKTKPVLSDCKLEVQYGYCHTHKQMHSACIQMAEGNLCHVCLEWHKPPVCALCECPYFSEHHEEGNCQNRAVYIVNRQYFDAAGFAVGDIQEAKVCAECKFPDDFNVREIPHV